MPRVAAPVKRRVRRAPRISGHGDYKMRPMVSASRGGRRLRGHGDYTYDKPGPWGKAGKWIGSALGSHFAGSGGGKLGEKLGSYLHYIGKIFGSGDYVTSAAGVKSNTLVNSSQIPQFAHGKSSVRIQHREYLCDVISSGTANTFNIQNYPINPGLVLTFPWLSQVVGANFQQYRINGMVFEFRSMSADALNSTNTALGSVIMATDYDSSDALFQNKAQMENTEYGVSCKPSSCMIHAIECARSQTPVNEQYVRFAANPTNTDIRLYDLGRFSVATTGMQGTSVNLGELWVSYDVELLKPIQNVPLAIGLGAAYSFTADNSHPFGGAATQVKNLTDQIGITFASNGTQFSVPYDTPVGTSWVVSYSVVGNSTASVPLPSITLAHGLVSQGNTFLYPPTTSTVANIYITTLMTYNGGGTPASPPSFSIAAGVVPAANAGLINILQVTGLASTASGLFVLN